MRYQDLVDSMSPETYRDLKRAVELGKWRDGRPLTPAQRESAMQAIIAWGLKHLDERDQVGFIDRKEKAGDICDDPLETPLSWKE